ncbi:MAG: hypothetical protein HUU50_09410 [Candidatus Brocadiae bacterium]|nr:hypothetical protein [Candidatus Brocadiia bacterium]
MAIAIRIQDEEWVYATKLNSNQEIFNYLSRNYVAKNSLQAEKIHGVEFIVKS